jgi:gamma-glutamyltranspeptidase/glutathione hydrolase
MTTSVEAAFGARILADGGTGLPGGYILNNQLTDFSFTPADAQGRPVANRLQPGKRPRSSMAPTLVFDRQSGQPLLVLGSPGGPLIPHFMARALLATLVGGQDVQRAIDGAHVADPGGPVLFEKGRFPAGTLQALQALGHRVLEVELPSGLHGIQRTPEGWYGGADPRREGVVRGD